MGPPVSSPVLQADQLALSTVLLAGFVLTEVATQTDSAEVAGVIAMDGWLA